MAKMPIEILEIGDVPTYDIRQALMLAERCQDEFIYSRLTKAECQKFSVLAFRKISSKEFFDRLEKIKENIQGYHPYILAVVDAELEDSRHSNIFGNHRGKKGLALLTTSNVENCIIPQGKMASYFVYYLARYTMSFLAPNYKNHDQTKGCIFDRKKNKIDLLKSMKARAICDNCREKLLTEESLSSAQLEALDKMFDASGKILGETISLRPSVFIASSLEGIELARKIKSELSQDLNIEVWDESDVFGLGKATIEALEEAVKHYNFGIFVFTPDDELITRGERKTVARDNVIFELGLFIGKLSRFRAFLVHPSKREICLPTDLAGMTSATYDPDRSNLKDSVLPAIQKIRDAIKKVDGC